MSQASDYLEKAILDHLFGKATFSSPTIYVALLTTVADDTKTGSTIVEANYTGYARKSTAASDWNAATTPGGAVTNANAIEFAPCTAGSSTIVGFALVDAASNGNMLCYGTCSLSVSAGITPRFAAGQLSVTLA